MRFASARTRCYHSLCYKVFIEVPQHHFASGGAQFWQWEATGLVRAVYRLGKRDALPVKDEVMMGDDE